MSMHHRDTQTSNATPFSPKSHAAVLLTVASNYTFTDRQGVEFDLDIAAAKVPFYLPVSVTSVTAQPTNSACIFLA